MTALPKRKYTLEEYFEIERSSEEKFEFWDGNVWSMAGASPEHERIVVNAGGHLRDLFRGRGCSVFGSNLKVKVPTYSPYRYPDLSAYYGPGIYEKIDGLDVLTNPQRLQSRFCRPRLKPLIAAINSHITNLSKVLPNIY